MIHVDVRRIARDDIAKGAYDYEVQTSIDGSRWVTRYIHTPTVGDTEDAVKQAAINTAMVYCAGMELAGVEVRLTSGGYTLNSFGQASCTCPMSLRERGEHSVGCPAKDVN